MIISLIINNISMNRSSIINELRLAGRLRCEPSLQAVGHAAAGTAVEPRRHADPDLQRMAEPVARGNGPGNNTTSSRKEIGGMPPTAL